jgi:hypothetical protein
MSKLLHVLLVVCLAAGIAAAQTGTGKIQGTVKDSTGAVIPTAAITATHLATARTYQTASNEVGFYLFPSLQIGSYKLSVALEGFETWMGDVSLESGQQAAVDPVLRVAGGATQITVAGDLTPTVNTTNATLSTVLERARIEQIPQDTRWVTMLMMKVIPGLEGGTWAPRVFGMRENSMELLRDGAELANRSEGDGGLPPAMDSLEEFRVETNNSSAKSARPASAIFVTKAGSNALHGSTFWVNRNSSVGVARRREDQWTKAPHMVRNEFGASLGGPVYLPKLYNGKNRTFFFFAYEAGRYTSGGTISRRVPTAAMRQGDFSGLVTGNGQKYTLYDPWSTDTRTWTRQPFTNNQIPVSRLSPIANYLYSLTPLPTMDVNPLDRDNWFGPGLVIRPEHTETVRIDHRLSERHHLFGRFSNARRLIGSPSSYAPTPNTETNQVFNIYNDNSAVFSWTHSLSPTFFGEFNANGFQEDYSFVVGADPGTNYASQLGLPNPFNKEGFPQFTNMGFSNYGFSASSPRGSLTRIFKFDEDLTKIHGRHTLQFGARLRYERLNSLPSQQQVAGAHEFNSMSTALLDPASGALYNALPWTGFAGANQFLGVAEYYSVQFVRGMYRFRSKQYATYFQDDFKVNDRLTLNLGVRWELSPPMSEADNFLMGFNPKTHAVVTGMTLDQMYQAGHTTPAIVENFSRTGMKFETAEQAGLPRNFIKGNYADIYPRMGFAWRSSGGQRPIVVRGGYSLYGFILPTGTFDAAMRTNPPSNARFEHSLNLTAQSPDGLPRYYLRSAPTVIGGSNSADILDLSRPNSVTRGSFSHTFFDPELPTTKAHEWNVTVEREVMDGTVARVAYVGTHQSNLDQYWNLNEGPGAYVWYSSTGKPLPTGEYGAVATRVLDQTTFGDISEYRRTGYANGNAFQFELKRRYNKGYGFQLFYVMQNILTSAASANSAVRARSMRDAAVFLPGTVPADADERNQFLNYMRDTSVPKHRVQFNWLVDLPMGRGKWLGRNAGGVLNKVIGGWQMAGNGSMRSNYITLPTSNWGYIGSPEVYGKQYPIQDCRSGKCFDGYLYYNGYIQANRINSYDANGNPNGVMGVPADYKPSHAPVFPTPAQPKPGDPAAGYYEQNYAWVTLADGTTQRVNSPDNGLHPWRNQFLSGLNSWDLNASLFKNVPLGERMNLRFQADFFNVLNQPGLQQPDASSGIITQQFSAKNARVLQLAARISW